MDLQLKDKVVLITGGAKGIGAAITRACVQESAISVIVDKDSAAANQLRSGLLSAGTRCFVISIDLTDVNACEAAVAQAVREFGQIDALVNNAGVNDGVSLEHGTPAKFLASLQINLLHYYNMAHYALPALKQTRGCIVNIASKVAITGQGGTSGYAAAKGAILALTREWAAELLPYEIRVNAILPAEVMTPLYEQWLSTFPNPEAKRKHIVAKIPLGKRMTEPQEIASMALFLISAQAAHITGQHISVDGGYAHLDRALT